MKSLTPAQIVLIVGSGKSPEQVASLTKLISTYGWGDQEGVQEALQYAQLRVADLPASLMPRSLDSAQKVLIVGSATTRDEVAAVITLVVEKLWIESSVLEALRQSVLNVQMLPPQQVVTQGSADSMATECLTAPTLEAMVDSSKDTLQLVMLDIAQDISNPLNSYFVPY